VETTSVEASAAETTPMTLAAARECFVVRGHQSSGDKRGNERPVILVAIMLSPFSLMVAVPERGRYLERPSR
jgi:hypothetical protein